MNILLIQIMRLGDAVQLVPVIQGLKSSYPDSSVHVLTSALGRKIFEKEPGIQALHVLDKQRIQELMSRSRKTDVREAVALLRKELDPVLQVRWDWVINFSFSYPSALLAFLTGCRRCSGFTVTPDRRYLSREPWFAHSLASFALRRYSNFNWVDVNREIVGLPSVPPRPRLAPDPGLLRSVSSGLTLMGCQGKTIIGMHPGASNDQKRWPVEKFGALGRALVAREGHRILIFGTSDERALGERLKNLIGAGAENLAGQTTIEELMAYLSLCRLLVSNDSGPMHLAASVGTPVIALFFNTHFVETGPYGAGHVALHPDIPCFPCQGAAKCGTRRCLDLIPPEIVAELAFHRLIGGKISVQRGAARAYVSSFDPWSFLEWLPLGGGPLRFRDLERLLLRVAWLSHTGIIREGDPRVQGYLTEAIQDYGPPEDRQGLLQQLVRLRQDLLGFLENLLQAGRLSRRMHLELLKGDPRSAAVADLGKRLAPVEEALAAMGKSESSVGFMSDLLAVFCENAEKKDLLGFCRSVADIYHDLSRFTEALLRRSGDVGEGLGEMPLQRSMEG